MTITCKTLMNIAIPELYRNNPFHILRLPVDATSKQIARRKEDIDAAFDMGAAQNEFFTYDGMCLPDKFKTDELFKSLEDPEIRLAYEFFWPWPDGNSKTDSVIQQIMRKGIDAFDSAKTHWKSVAADILAVHNLAVVYHCMGLEYEFSLLRNKQISSQNMSALETYWDRAINCWNELADNDKLWEKFSERMAALNDPRLTTGFIHRFRQDFPLAFDQINANLAERYAKIGMLQEAQRHRHYMDISQAGLDDVQGSLENVFDKIEQTVQRITKTAAEATAKNPEQGIVQARALLSEAREPLNIAKGLLDEGHELRKDIFETVTMMLNQCVVQYGNKTANWQPCIDLLKVAEGLAVTEAAKQRLKRNREVAEKNYKDRIQINIVCKIMQTVKDITETAIGETKANPREGLAQARILLSKAQEPLTNAKKLLNEGTELYQNISDAVALTANECIIQYGNATTDWQSCIDLLAEAEKVAVTKAVEQRLEQNRKVAEDNLQNKRLHETCWFCKHEKAQEESAMEVKMYGEVTRDFLSNRISWRTITVKVPCCKKCEARFRANSDSDFSAILRRFVVAIIIGIVVAIGINIILGVFVGFIILIVGLSTMHISDTGETEKLSYPEVQRLAKNGFSVGEKPPEAN